MKKSLQINIMVDDVEYDDIEEIEKTINALLEKFEYKRMFFTIQDRNLVKPPER